MNAVIQLLQSHRSIRKFKDIPLRKEQLEAIVTSAQMASSSSNVQAYSIVAVSDPDKKTNARPPRRQSNVRGA